MDSVPQPAMYWPLKQFGWAVMWVAIRTDGDPAALAGAMRREVAAVDPAIVLLLAIAVVASLWPARRAARLDPVQALQAE